MGPALNEFKAGAFLQSQNRNRKAQKEPSEEAQPGTRASVSLPEGRHGAGNMEAGMSPRSSLYPAQGPPGLRLHCESAGLGVRAARRAHPGKERPQHGPARRRDAVRCSCAASVPNVPWEF